MRKISDLERHLFFEGLQKQYGYDFRNYAEASLDRRLTHVLDQMQLESLLDLLKIALRDHNEFRKILPLLTINTTEFFRDPHFFKTLRDTVFPVLKTYSKITIWSAGCSTGEEVLSLAIALKEEDLLKRTTIHATDINHQVLKIAREGIYDSSVIPLFNRNYASAGGTGSPSDYYSAEYGLVRFNRDLLEKVVFSEHNLATDSAFLEAHLILCRNVLIYFNRELQNRALQIFANSLVHKGFLALGPKETLHFSHLDKLFIPESTSEKIYIFDERAAMASGYSQAGGSR